MDGGAEASSFPFYKPDDETQIVFINGANRKDGCIAIKTCTLPKLIEKMTQTITYEVVQLIIARHTGPPADSSKDNLRLFEIEIEIVQTKQLIGTLNDKDFENSIFSNISIEFINSLSEDIKNELFLMFFKARKLTKPAGTRSTTQRPQTTNISSAASTMRFSFSVSPKTQSPNSTSNVLTGLLSNGSPNNTQMLQSSSSFDSTTRASMKIPKGIMSKILPNGSNGSSVSPNNNSLHSSVSSGNLGLNNSNPNLAVIDEDFNNNEMIARELTVMEFELMTALTLNEFSQKAWNKEGRAINIQNFIVWFNRISSWVTTKIISKETPEERAIIIEAFINIANYAKELKNYNCVMEILGSLHNSAICRLKGSWALISQKASELFYTLDRLMSPDNNFRNYRKHLGMVLPNEPCIPYLGLFLTDYTYLDESNPPLLNGMINIERIYLIGNRVQEFFQLFTNCGYNFVSNPPVRDAILGEKVWDENETFRLSKIREERKNFVAKYRMSFTGNDPAPSIASALSERDWKILTTNAKVIRHKKGKRILSMGEVNNNLYRVLNGRVKFENPSAPEETRYIECGDIFGEDSFLYDRPMLHNVLSDSDECELIEIEKTFILQLFTSEPILAATYYKHIAVLMAERLKFVLSNDAFQQTSIQNNSLGLYGSSGSLGGSSSGSNNNTPNSMSPKITSYSHSQSLSQLSLVDKRKSIAFEPGKFLGIHKQKMNPFEKITKILPEKGALSLTTNDKIKKFSFKSQEDLTEAYGIMTKIWKNHFGIVRSPTKSVMAATTPPTPPRSPKVGRGESFSNIPDVPTKEEWASIFKGSKAITFRKGEILVTEGVEFQKIFYITRGECTIVKGLTPASNNGLQASGAEGASPPVISTLSGKNLILLAKLSPGSIFGEMSFLLPGGSSTSVIVSSDELEVFTLEGYFLNIMLKSKTALAPKFYKYLACVLESRVKQYRQTLL
eukprot:gene14228-16787_t